MDKRVLRYDVGINDRAHRVPAGVPVLFERSERHRVPGLESRVDAWFEVWTPDGWPEQDIDRPMQWVQIVGTGQPVPETWSWLKSFPDIGGLVWHLYRVPDEEVRDA